MSDPMTRREFVRGMTVAASGAAIGWDEPVHYAVKATVFEHNVC